MGSRPKRPRMKPDTAKAYLDALDYCRQLEDDGGDSEREEAAVALARAEEGLRATVGLSLEGKLNRYGRVDSDYSERPELAARPEQAGVPEGPWEAEPRGTGIDDDGAEYLSPWWCVTSPNRPVNCLTEPEALSVRDALNLHAQEGK